ncbi:MAG TPA: sodium/proton-translocating pyrophosphatase, partial [Aggregatilineaceae bacterium]|nr:sodium/proton-translocating pyrophosphatase [Aggregatilineaceae bacterium]
MFKMDSTLYEQAMMFVVLAIAGLALVYALWLRSYIMAADKGSAEMQRNWGYIRNGANAYLRTQLRTVALMIVLLTVAMFLSVFVVKPTPEANEYFNGNEDRARIVIAIARALAFVMGSSFSAMVGFFGMNMAVQGNVRVAAAAERGGYQEALKIAYRSGTITG